MFTDDFEDTVIALAKRVVATYAEDPEAAVRGMKEQATMIFRDYAGKKETLIVFIQAVIVKDDK